MDGAPDNTKPSAKGNARLGPHSRVIDRGSVGWSIDGRSREGRFLRAYEAMLQKHVGGHPSRVHLEIIRRCARLALHLELQDEKTLTGQAMSDSTARTYVTWHRTLIGSLRQLGLEAAKASRPSLRDYLDGRTDAPA